MPVFYITPAHITPALQLAIIVLSSVILCRAFWLSGRISTIDWFSLTNTFNFWPVCSAFYSPVLTKWIYAHDEYPTKSRIHLSNG